MTAATGWIRRFSAAADPRGRVLCFPHAGGSATFYFPLAKLVAPAVELLAVQYPGRQDRRGEPCAGSITEMAQATLSELLALPELPLVLFGHSMGALVAFEVAKLLEDKGVPPSLLVISGRRGPGSVRDEAVRRTDDASLVAALRETGMLSSQVLNDPDVLQMILPAMRADYDAVLAYRHRPGMPLSCPVLVLTGDRDPQVTVGEAGDWARHTTGRFGTKVLAGDHFFLTSHLDVIAAEIVESLEFHGSV